MVLGSEDGAENSGEKGIGGDEHVDDDDKENDDDVDYEHVGEGEHAVDLSVCNNELNQNERDVSNSEINEEGRK